MTYNMSDRTLNLTEQQHQYQQTETDGSDWLRALPTHLLTCENR